MFDLSGKKALVTGASGGIGGAIAAALHAQGATVALSGTKLPALETLAAKLGERTAIVPADLADPEACEKLIADAEAALGQIDILVNLHNSTAFPSSVRTDNGPAWTGPSLAARGATRVQHRSVRRSTQVLWAECNGVDDHEV